MGETTVCKIYHKKNIFTSRRIDDCAFLIISSHIHDGNFIRLGHREIGSIGPAVFTLAMIDPKLTALWSILAEDI
jgi:hypothetical protein